MVPHSPQARRHGAQSQNSISRHSAGKHSPNNEQTERKQNDSERFTIQSRHAQQIQKGEQIMPNKVDLEHLEENITGVFLSFLERGGVDVNSLDALARVKHNTFDCALIAVFEKLFRPEKNQPNNQRSLLPYNDNNILQQLVDIYFRLCNLTDNDSTLQGFECLTGYDYGTLCAWQRDELNPERLKIIKSITQKRQGMIENKLSDHPIGATALANNSESLGLKWAANSAPKINSVTAFVLPGEGVRQALEQRMNAGQLPKSADNASIINE